MFRLLLLLSLAMPLYAETVYKVVRPDGTVEFSDEPVPDAQELQVDEVPTISFPKPAPKPASETPAKKKVSAVTYTKVAITSPKPEETIRSNEHKVPFSVSLEPALAKGHQVVVRLDGKEVARGASTSMTLTEVYRGAHTVAAAVVDGKGKEIAVSDPVIFYLQRHAISPQ